MPGKKQRPESFYWNYAMELISSCGEESIRPVVIGLSYISAQLDYIAEVLEQKEQS